MLKHAGLTTPGPALILLGLPPDLLRLLPNPGRVRAAVHLLVSR